ncbi:hypothetical protein IPD43_26160 [Paenibacillus polymyxa]|uniref:hypothetical protein n=1 Tax=Paenibacillus polymyxa TaxID=1406 RepID=UPI0012B54C88|nr:hypothetical protein [Paenibacillus polymyxa]MBE7901118.1 hypothetical protein [Paenibacillus polymyxa]WEK68069.1 hypothetical protein ERJ71_26955 [Paenibacillus polymyxa]
MAVRHLQFLDERQIVAQGTIISYFFTYPGVNTIFVKARSDLLRYLKEQLEHAPGYPALASALSV